MMTFQARRQTGHRLQLCGKAGGWREKKRRVEQANINSTQLYISICSTNVLFAKENKVSFSDRYFSKYIHKDCLLLINTAAKRKG